MGQQQRTLGGGETDGSDKSPAQAPLANVHIWLAAEARHRPARGNKP